MTDYELLSELPDHIQESGKAHLNAIDQLRLAGDNLEAENIEGSGDTGNRHLADGRTLQQVPDNAVSISDRSEAPEGAQIITGPGGGLYYVPGGDGDSDAADERPGSDVDFDSVEQTPIPLVGGEAPRLSEDEREKVWQVIEDETGEGADQLQDIQMAAKEKSYSPEGQTRERAFLRAAGLDLDIRNGDIDGEDPSDELVEAAGAFQEASQKAFAEIQGENAEVHRGLSDEATEGLLIDAIATDGDGVSIDTFGMTNFTTEREVADRFGSDSATISTEVSSDEVLAYTDALMDTQQEGEVSIEGGRRELSVDDVEIGVLGRSFNLSEQLEDPNSAFLSRLEGIDNPDVQEFVEAHQ